MKFNEDYVPSTLDEAIQCIYESLSEEDIALIKRADAGGLHFGLGMFLRNNFSLWEKDTPLGNDIKERFGLIHGDDKSGLILAGLKAKVCGKDIQKELELEAKSYISHWKLHGIDPLTQEPIPGTKSPTSYFIKRDENGRIFYE